MMHIERRMWNWVDWAMFAVLTLWLGMAILIQITDPKTIGEANPYIFSISLFVTYLSMLIFWHPGYINRLALQLVVVLTALPFEMYLCAVNNDHTVTLLVFPLMVLGLYAYGRLHLFNIILYILAVPVVQYLFLVHGKENMTGLINMILNYSLFYGVGFSINRMTQSNLSVRTLYEQNLRQYHLIQEQNLTLQQYANQVEKLTLLEERNRLARELHDTVGHTFTSVIMGMDAVSYLMDAAPVKAKEKLDVLRQVTRNGLEEVRRSIHQIAPQQDEGTLTQQLARLAGEFAVHTGTKVRVEHVGEERELPMQAQLTLIRCLQESLTNAKRHGLAFHVNIRLEFHEEQVILLVEDDGKGSKHLEAGFGLTAMRERLTALQGTLYVSSEEGSGTVVSCTIPTSK